MKIYHISDSHGSGFWSQPLPEDVDVVAHTGDLLPNISRGVASKEVPFQAAWISRFAADIKAWLNGRPLVYVPGNHDYIELSDFMPCYRASAQPMAMLGKKWVGFREIPWIRGEWAGELRNPELGILIDNLFEAWSQSISEHQSGILLSHSPPAGILDKDIGGFIHYGMAALSNALQYKQHNFAAILFGHVHLPTYTQVKSMNMLFSNAADNSGGVVELT